MAGGIGDEPELAGRLARLEGEIRDLNRRLEAAEGRHRRRARRVGAGAFLAATLLCAGGAALLRERTPRVEVVGPNNDVRVSIAVDPITGSAGIEVFGVNGRKLIFLGTSQAGLPNLAFYDPTGTRIVREVAP